MSFAAFSKTGRCRKGDIAEGYQSCVYLVLSGMLNGFLKKLMQQGLIRFLSLCRQFP